MAPEEQNDVASDEGMPEAPEQIDLVEEEGADLNLDEPTEEAPVEEEEVPQNEVGPGFPMPPVEIILHNAVTDIAHVPTPNGTMTLARFITPAFVMTLKLDERGKNGLIKELLTDETPKDIVVPKPGIIIPGR